MKKNILRYFFIIFIMFMTGCASEDEIQIINVSGSSYRTHDFGDEQYVWENFIFTTNRVNEVK